MSSAIYRVKVSKRPTRKPFFMGDMFTGSTEEAVKMMKDHLYKYDGVDVEDYYYDVRPLHFHDEEL